jgi:DNA-binding transcriptional regulator YiaG
MNAHELSTISRARALASSGAARSIREAAGITLRELAENLETSVSTVWYWEQGRKVPRSDYALRYGQILDELLRVHRGGPR